MMNKEAEDAIKNGISQRVKNKTVIDHNQRRYIFIRDISMKYILITVFPHSSQIFKKNLKTHPVHPELDSYY
jgi:hypothetical protein